jgi:hypothetical protein
LRAGLTASDNGIIKTLEQPVYLTRVKGQIVHCLDRTDEIAAADDLKHLVVVLSDKGKFESVLGRVDGDGPRLGGSVPAQGRADGK